MKPGSLLLEGAPRVRWTRARVAACRDGRSRSRSRSRRVGVGIGVGEEGVGEGVVGVVGLSALGDAQGSPGRVGALGATWAYRGLGLCMLQVVN